MLAEKGTNEAVLQRVVKARAVINRVEIASLEAGPVKPAVASAACVSFRRGCAQAATAWASPSMLIPGVGEVAACVACRGGGGFNSATAGQCLDASAVENV